MTTLRHIALPCWPRAPAPKYPSYAYATEVMAQLRRSVVQWKISSPATRGPAPAPTLLSFTPAPTYTFGRRQLSVPGGFEARRLRAPLLVRPDLGLGFAPELAHAPRGGLTTYHGPGQVVLWPVVDLRAPGHAHFTVRDYACLLQRTTVAALGAEGGGAWFTTPENPGVWTGGAAEDGAPADERKVAALGVYLKRHVTGLGVAVNYATPVTGPQEENPWARIVACGLQDKRVTSVREEERRRRRQGQEEEEEKEEEVDDEVAMKRLADTWAEEFAKRLGATGGVEAKRLDEVEELRGCGDDGAYVEARRLADLV
ncbi:hypothetical protein F4775DRAFT_593555 [Biscogniauxia sp. FL1348]|nr:hypothetical protein F4775DRAFT_593555 [Biscogniauxia sp. FL1348]